MRISVYNWWFRCPICKAETSISSSSPLEYDQQLTCIKCKQTVEVTSVIGEPQVGVRLVEY